MLNSLEVDLHIQINFVTPTISQKNGKIRRTLLLAMQYTCYSLNGTNVFQLLKQITAVCEKSRRINKKGCKSN